MMRHLGLAAFAFSCMAAFAAETDGPGTYFVPPKGTANVTADVAAKPGDIRKTVAFLGGSITEMNGFRPLVMKALRAKYPQVAFREIAAGLSSTCSDAGAFRLDEDVLNRAVPDLFIVEEAVNDEQDGHFSETRCLRGMEGIVRRVLTRNPSCAVVVGLMVNRKQYTELKAGKTPIQYAAHAKVARHYGAAVADVGSALVASERSGGLGWSLYRDCHPSPTGCVFGAGIVMDAVAKVFDPTKPPVARALPEPLDPNSYFRGCTVPASKFKLGAWAYSVPDWKSIPGAKRGYYTRGPSLWSETEAAEMEFGFSGTSAGAFLTAGPDAGDLEVSVDGGAYVLKKLRSTYGALHYPYVQALADDLADGPHTIRLRVAAAEHNGKKTTAVRIHRLYVNGTADAALAAGACAAYTQAPGMKTPWGEKVTPENAWREYPRPQLVRDAWTNLNGLWQYAILSGSPSFPTNWNGQILVPFAVESSLSGVGKLLAPTNTLWYRRTFAADVKSGTRLLLNFEQADFRTQVFVNRVEVGVPHEGGQMPFSFDVTDYVKPGENELIVAIWDPTGFIGSTGKQSMNPRGCFYTRSSGIGGTVWLETVPETHVTDYRVVTDVDAGTVSVTVDGAGNLSEAEVKVEVRREGRTLAQGEMKAWGRPVTLALPRPLALWSPETPELYDLVITMKDDATDAKDVVKGYFGLRKFELRKDANGVLRFFFNNAPRFIIGTLDQGWWPDGLLTPPSDEAMAFDILQLKKMGFDMMRKHIKVEPRRYYHLCDKLGILVLQDMPSGGGGNENRYGFYRRELKEMMDHLQKTPSIVMWVPYNEAWGQPGPFLTHSTLMWVQRYDPTRLVNGPSGWNDWEGGQNNHGNSKHLAAGEEEAAHAVDKHDYGFRPRMFPVNDRRASFLGEFGGIGCRVKGHLWTENAWGYGGTGNDTDRASVQQKFVSLMEHVGGLAYRGLAGSVYTQTTDVEGEINGLITYDRKVVKFDADALAAVHAKVRKLAASGPGGSLVAGD